VPAVACASERVYDLVKNAPKSHGAESDVPTRAVSPKLSNVYAVWVVGVISSLKAEKVSLMPSEARVAPSFRPRV